MAQNEETTWTFDALLCICSCKYNFFTTTLLSIIQLPAVAYIRLPFYEAKVLFSEGRGGAPTALIPHYRAFKRGI